MSYSDIMKALNVSKGTLSSWCKCTTLTPQQTIFLNEEMAKKSKDARARTIMTNKNRRILRDNAIIAHATADFERFLDEKLFMAGILLYWGEGTKKGRSFSFINSDPEMISLMTLWVEKYLGVSRKEISFRLYVHDVYLSENLEEYWANLLGVPEETFRKTVVKKSVHTTKRNPEYLGCFQIRVGPVSAYVKVMTWQKLLARCILPNIAPVA